MLWTIIRKARNNCQDMYTTVGMKTTQDVGNCGDEDHCQYHLGIDHCHTGNHCQNGNEHSCLMIKTSGLP